MHDEESKKVICGLLQFNQMFEEYVYLGLTKFALVISLNNEDSDEKILKHYGTRGVMGYESCVSKDKFPGYDKQLKLSKVNFLAEEKIPFDEKVAEELKQKALVEDHVQYKLEAHGNDEYTLDFAWRNIMSNGFLYRLAVVCRLRNMQIHISKFSVVDPITQNTILFGHLELKGTALADQKIKNEFIREFSMMRDLNIEDRIGQDLVMKKVITNNEGMLLRAFATLCEQFLSEADGSLYCEDNVIEAFCFHADITTQILNAFDCKFNPENKDVDKYEKIIAKVKQSLAQLDTGKKKHDDRRKTIFRFFITLVDHVLKTNYYCLHRLAIGFRLCPKFIDEIPGFDRKSKYPEVPFGLFYIRGNNFFGFHCRFRDLARGGLRTVIMRDQEQAKYEKTNMFSECYNLAYTQQKKNKDIPEGGSKGICYLYPNKVNEEIAIIKKQLLLKGKEEKEIDEILAKYTKEATLEYLHFNQRLFVSTFLTLFTCGDDEKLKNKQIIDYYGHPEFIYLGPDENMHDCIIEWIAKESKRQGYHAKGAFISGKEETGINHKEYGVTSLGVFQYLKQGLEYIGLKDKPYTIKMSGGADGDVGGNLIRLLNKHHKEFAKLLVITDGFGTAYDPQGLDLGILDKFFYEVKGINNYPPESLHEGGFILCVWKTRQKTAFQKETLIYRKKDGKVVEDWIPSNEAMHIYATNAHQVQTDVFAPCGGRPRSLNANNIQTFFVDGKPTCKLITEGANLYLTAEARQALEDAGVLIFKDSSANKCGVISSSYEILGGLALDDPQFVEMKAAYAKDLLVRLEEVANQEAKCMLDYYKETKHQVRMVAISDLVSQKVNMYTDAIAEYLKPLDLFKEENKKLLQIFIDYVPKVLLDGYREQVMKRVPQMHMKAIIATSLATKIVYGKGLGWDVSIVDVLPLLLQ